MAVVTVRNIPDETHQAIKASARLSGRSAEAEIREALEERFRPKEQLGIGSAIHALAMKYGGFDDLVLLEDDTPAISHAAVFE